MAILFAAVAAGCSRWRWAPCACSSYAGPRRRTSRPDVAAHRVHRIDTNSSIESCGQITVHDGGDTVMLFSVMAALVVVQECRVGRIAPGRDAHQRLPGRQAGRVDHPPRARRRTPRRRRGSPSADTPARRRRPVGRARSPRAAVPPPDARSHGTPRHLPAGCRPRRRSDRSIPARSRSRVPTQDDTFSSSVAELGVLAEFGCGEAEELVGLGVAAGPQIGRQVDVTTAVRGRSGR